MEENPYEPPEIPSDKQPPQWWDNPDVTYIGIALLLVALIFIVPVILWLMGS